LRDLGVDGVFPTGSRLDAIAEFVHQRVAQRQAADIPDTGRPR
jgi:hypothetical protein